METLNSLSAAEPFDPSRYEQEAAQRWGDSAAYLESMRPTRRYAEEDWRAIRAEDESLLAKTAALMAAPVEPSDPAAMALAEGHRRHIERWFYPCDYQLHVCLAEMYTADGRFAAHFERRGEGLAAFLKTAIVANAARHAGA